MLWGCISAHGTGDVQICEGTINAEEYIQVLETYAAIQMSSSVKALIISARQCQTTFCMHYNSIIKRLRVLTWPTCSPDLQSPIENILCSMM